MNVYEVITARIVEMLEQGTIPWRKPWKAGAGEPRNLVSGKGYRGINVFLLSAMGFASPYWLTYRQATERGGSVKKGSKGCPVVFWRWGDRNTEQSEDEADDKSRRKAPLLRYYTVFNVDQCEGITAPTEAAREFEPIAECERIVHGMPNAPRIEHQGSQAFYRPSTDTVVTPKPELFDSAELFYSVLFHELTHSTGHASRLARKGITDATMFGSLESCSVAASVPAVPHMNAAPISAINSSRLYSCEPNIVASVIPLRARRDAWPVLCVSS